MYDIFDVVRIPFPFSDLNVIKTRPVLVLSSYEIFGKESGCSVTAMITSATNSSFPLDVPITNPAKAGLKKKFCLVRMKFFTIDNRLIEEKVGTLDRHDRKAVSKALRQLMSGIIK